MKVDSQGRIHLTGYTYSLRFPTTGNALQRFPGNGSNPDKLSGIPDAFLVTLNPNLSAAESLVYASYIGTPGLDYGYGVSANGSGCSVAVTGTTTSKTMPTTANAFERNSFGYPDTFLSIVNICQ